MKIRQIISENIFKATPIYIHIGGYNGRPVPKELQKFIKKHVKTSKNGSLYISEYPDSWYFRTFGDNSPSPNTNGIHDFKTFMNIFKPYFSIQKILPVNK